MVKIQRLFAKTNLKILVCREVKPQPFEELPSGHRKTRGLYLRSDGALRRNWVSALLCDGEDVCLRMIERGAAWPYFHYFNRMPRDVAQRYRHAFELARRDRIGLWQEENPEAPWNWRKRHRSWWTRFVFWLKRVLGLC